ncbi:MAG: exopolysaccharide biosynthesis polyprenyl glycosylphosphotransferase [Gammaproteobacteria bacterium]|nr:exopolysaccharide biosynthesis polyprenyl glycosylphosphotransferase [Gammaproteobacteria bacterium]
MTNDNGFQRQGSVSWIPSENLLALVLLLVDLFGVFAIFNLSHWLVTEDPSVDLLLIWKLVLISCCTFLMYYLLDLYTFDSTLSQLGMLERSLIGMLLVGATMAIFVYIMGPAFIGGFVGRGVLAMSLGILWMWSLAWRYLINAWLQSHRSQLQWLVMISASNLDLFISHFRSIYKQDNLLFLIRESSGQRELDLDPNSRIVGDWDALDATVERYDVAGVIVVSRSSLPADLVDRLLKIRFRGTRIYDINDFYEKFLSRLPVFNLDQNWIAMSHGFDLIHNPMGLRLKRYLDVSIALMLTLLLLPLLMLTAVLVLVTSGTPVLFNQIRTGENDVPFRVYKFRTMVQDAESDGAQYASKKDPRITPLGKLMRKFRLDELPQLWNVLVGDMSFIGPRPERPEFISTLQQRIPYYDLRHTVKPGLTGWAQVMYGYGDSTDDAEEKLQYDLFYIKNYSLALDLSIIVRSIKVILFGTGR